MLGPCITLNLLYQIYRHTQASKKRFYPDLKTIINRKLPLRSCLHLQSAMAHCVLSFRWLLTLRAAKNAHLPLRDALSALPSRKTGYEASIFGWWSLLLISPPYISLWRWQYCLLASVEIWVGLNKVSLIFFTDSNGLSGAHGAFNIPRDISNFFSAGLLLTNCTTFNNQITPSDKISKAPFPTWTKSHTCRRTLSHSHTFLHLISASLLPPHPTPARKL